MNTQQFSKRSLSRKLTAYIVLSSTLVTTFAIGIMLFLQYESDVEKLNQRLESIRLSTLPSIEKSLWEFNDLQVQVLIDSLMTLGDIANVEVKAYTWDGQLKRMSAKGGKPQESSVLTKTFDIVRHEGGENITLGELYVEASLDNVHNNLWQQAKVIVITQGIKTLIITTVILLLVQALLTRHLHTIATHAKSLKLYSGYTPLELKRSKQIETDELDDVVDTLNQMQLSLLEEQRRELQLQKERSFAEANSKAKSEFLSHMSHEIRTPMNGVIGLLELMDGDNLNMEQKRYLELVKKSGQALMIVINDILDLSKIEANKLLLKKKCFSMSELINECTALYTASAKEKNIRIVENIDASFQFMLGGDPLRIRQILLNLISNAVKHTEDGEILITVTKEEDPQHRKDTVIARFSVKDTGEGIDEENQQRIFEAFEQGNDETSKGTGLGLTICKKLCELMDGKLGLSSSLHEGSEFWFSLPLEEGDACNQSIVTTETEAPPKLMNFSELNEKGVLVVEDNLINQQVIDSLLKKLGIEAIIVENGLEACEFKEKHSNTFPLILMDCEMPVMDGFEASRNIRQQEQENQQQKSIIVSLSAYTDNAHKEKCIEAGMDYSMSKPVTLTELQRTLVKVNDQLANS